MDTEKNECPTSKEPVRMELITCEHCRHKWEEEAKPFDMPNKGEDDGEWFKIVGICPQCRKAVIHFIHKYTIRSTRKSRKKKQNLTLDSQSGEKSQDRNKPDDAINMIVEIPI